MGYASNNNERGLFLVLRSRDLPFAYAMLLLLAAVTICSMAWLFLSNDRLVSTRLSLPQRTSARFMVNINHAPWPEIANLPKVGPSLAKAIVEHREIHGTFENAEALIEVSGIGPKKLAAIKPFLLPIL